MDEQKQQIEQGGGNQHPPGNAVASKTTTTTMPAGMIHDGNPNVDGDDKADVDGTDDNTGEKFHRQTTAQTAACGPAAPADAPASISHQPFSTPPFRRSSPSRQRQPRRQPQEEENDDHISRTSYNSHCGAIDPPGRLDEFLRYHKSDMIYSSPLNGRNSHRQQYQRGVTIRAVPHPSPDKTASTVSWSQSPDVVMEFPHVTTTTASDGRARTRVGHVENDETNGDAFDNLLQVVILSSMEPTSFYLPISLLLEREIEMQETARVHKIGRERWSSSRLFRMWKSQSQKMAERRQHDATVATSPSTNDFNGNNNIEVTPVQVTPEVSLQASSRSSSMSSSMFRWKAWLTSCIRSYYNTGNLRIPSECRGDDLLLALEYFGILTASPDTFIFESADAYERVQSWSRYFTKRSTLKEQLLDDYDEVEQSEEGTSTDCVKTDDNQNFQKTTRMGQPRLWVLLPFSDQADAKQNGEQPSQSRSDVFYRVENHEPARRLVSSNTQDCMYDLFVDNHLDDVLTTASAESHMLTMELPTRLRQDFAEFVRQSLPPRTAVQFEMNEVVTEGLAQSGRYPVLRIGSDQGDVPKLFHDRLSERGEDQMINVDDVVARTLKELNLSARSKQIGRVSETTTNDEVQLPVRVLFPEVEEESELPATARNDRPSRPITVAIHHQDSTLKNAVAYVAHVPKLAEKKSDPLIDQRQDGIVSTTSTAIPVNYINTDFGDLRSVTSLLTEPTVDHANVVTGDSVVAYKSRNHDTKKKRPVKRMGKITGTTHATQVGRPDPPPRMLSILDTETSVSSSALIKTPPKAPRKTNVPSPLLVDMDASSVANLQGHPHFSKEDTESASTPVDKALARSSQVTNEKPDAMNQEHRSWANFLATVCDTVVPGSASSDVCRSSHSCTSSVPFVPDINGATCSTSRRLLKEGQGCIQSTITNPDEFMERASTEFLEQAKRFGNDITVSLIDVLNAIMEDHGDDRGLEPIQEEGSYAGTSDMTMPSDEEIMRKKSRSMSNAAKSSNSMYQANCQAQARSRDRIHSSRITKNTASPASNKQRPKSSTKSSRVVGDDYSSDAADSALPVPRRTKGFDSDSLFDDDGNSYVKMPPHGSSRRYRSLRHHHHEKNKLPATRRRKATTETPSSPSSRPSISTDESDYAAREHSVVPKREPKEKNMSSNHHRMGSF